ncbi:hypothetical protein C0583_01295 [Candidatus Parcubacteria bacterium]|nr:MAG: hypothetical protein C0583_01295 [Candidatus Parcubacteria bacterium]
MERRCVHFAEAMHMQEVTDILERYFKAEKFKYGSYSLVDLALADKFPQVFASEDEIVKNGLKIASSNPCNTYVIFFFS